jgi:hypothetical protein
MRITLNYQASICTKAHSEYIEPFDVIMANMRKMSKRAIKILLAAPRGFCAGVDRAIQIVELALERYGKPIYVRHEIVHNRHVVEGLERRGAIFIDELDQVPDGGMVIFSAHGVAKSVPEAARQRGLMFLDATCPLVTKVHREAENHHAKGRHVVMLGHAGATRLYHPDHFVCGRHRQRRRGLEPAVS